jgi:hypothetical protein
MVANWNATIRAASGKYIKFLFQECYRLVREMNEQAQSLRARMQGTERLIQCIQETCTYRLARALLAPAQLLRNLWRCFR